MDNFVVKARGLTRYFGQVRAVDGIDFQVQKGEILGLIGPDGAGKSTTLRMLAGVIGIDKGEVHILGIDPQKNSRALKNLIGYMPQKFSLYGDLTVEENLKFFADLYGITGSRYQQRETELLNFSRLGPHRKKLAAHLSGGMQKKLALSCNLIHHPPVLILDEPTNGVDPLSRREFWGLLYQLLSSGTAIIISTPYMDEAERCSRVALLYEGKILVLDHPAHLTKSLEGKVVEISSDLKPEVISLFPTLPGIKAAYPFHGRIHLILENQDTSLSKFLGEARKQHIPIAKVQPVPPRFEDIFIYLIGEQKRTSS